MKCGLDVVLEKLKCTLFKSMVTKWSSHTHDNLGDCKQTLTFDGLWKTTRAKCCYDDIEAKTDFGPIPIGCIKSPTKGSYYCKQHQGVGLVFKVDDKKRVYKPEDIRATKIHNCKLFCIHFYILFQESGISISMIN